MGTAGSVVAAIALAVLQSTTDAAVGGLAVFGSGDDQPTGAAAGAAVQKAADDGAGTPATPVSVTSTWPVARGCDGATEVAAPPGIGAVTDFVSTGDVRGEVVEAGGGSWQLGHLTISIAVPAGGQPVTVVDLKPHVDRRDLSAPAWILSPQGGCGGSTQREFVLDLDEPSLRDAGVVDDGGDPTATVGLRSEPLGPEFSVDPGDSALLQVETVSCRHNYQWSLDLTLLVAGELDPRVQTLGPFLSFGSANATQYVVGQQGTNGKVDVFSTETIDGAGPRGCSPYVPTAVTD